MSDERTCDDCGQPFPTFELGYCGGSGYADFPDGKRVCYPCADIRQRNELATADHYFGYLSNDGRQITTWTGGDLLNVTSSSTREVGFGGARTYFRAVGPDGVLWYGNSPGRNMYARLHRSKRERTREGR